MAVVKKMSLLSSSHIAPTQYFHPHIFPLTLRSLMVPHYIYLAIYNVLHFYMQLQHTTEHHRSTSAFARYSS